MIETQNEKTKTDIKFLKSITIIFKIKFNLSFLSYCKGNQIWYSEPQRIFGTKTQMITIYTYILIRQIYLMHRYIYMDKTFLINIKLFCFV